MTAPLAYVTLRSDYSPGAFRQVRESARVAVRNSLPYECYWVRAKGSPHPVPEHVRVIEVDARFGAPGFRIAQYLAVARLARSRPRIMLRYPIADPALLALASHIDTLITEHHAKEVEELSAEQSGRAQLERWFGPSVLRRTAGMVGVTREILEYEQARARIRRPGLVAGNAIDMEGNTPDWMHTERSAPAGPLRLIFVASTMHPWHGLDLIIDALAGVASDRVTLHVCGRADASYQQHAARLAAPVVFHGLVDSAALERLYAQTHIAVGSFGLHRKGLSGASGLKVRGYLRAGLPVAIEGDDEALPRDFPYALRLRAFDIQALEHWRDTLGRYRPIDVREAARPYISLDLRLRRLIEFAGSLS